MSIKKTKERKKTIWSTVTECDLSKSQSFCFGFFLPLCVCWTHACRCMCTCVWRPTLGVSPQATFTLLSCGVFYWPGVCCVCKGTWLVSHRQLCPHPQCCHDKDVPGFSTWVLGWNAGPWSIAVSVLLAKLPPHPLAFVFVSFCLLVVVFLASPKLIKALKYGPSNRSMGNEGWDRFTENDC